ncbi:hypothetical protein PHSC3_000098 [Chlamydiales bacterium STE3]|nr:hypothetical protein PHSC3_000098 [Chlamydiales bacterium STE3]
MDIKSVCRSYLSGFKDIASKQPSKTAIGLIKVLSYLTLIAPLAAGITYGIAHLAGRVKKSDATSRARGASSTNSVAQPVLGNKASKSTQDSSSSASASSSQKEPTTELPAPQPLEENNIGEDQPSETSTNDAAAAFKEAARNQGLPDFNPAERLNVRQDQPPQASTNDAGNTN